MHPQLDQQIRLSIRNGVLDPDLLVRLVDTGYREADARIHMLIDRFVDPVLVTDEQYQLLEANPAARVLLGIAQGPLNTLELRTFLPELRIDESLQNAQGALLFSEENTSCRDVNGQSFHGEVSLFVLKIGEQGKRVCTLRKIPDAVCANTDDAGDNKIQEEFLAMMSHELRTPMNAVLGMARHLVSSDLDAEQRESVKTILDAGDVMMSLLNDLLDKSKIDAGKLSLEVVNVDLRHLLRKMERLWRPTIENNGVAFSLRVADSVPAVIKGDSVRIRQILSNLLSNAAKFTKIGSVTLEVGSEQHPDGTTEVEFAVRDTGIGMDKEVQSRLFGAYEQASDSTRREFGGTGLGLSISRNLAQMMGGDINVQSQSGIGSVFRFVADFESAIGLKVEPPLEKPSTHSASMLATAPSNSKPAAPNAAEEKLRILAVEDNPINQRVLAAFLRPIGCDVVWAGDGKEALATLDTARFDVVLMDIQMPVMDGLEATRALRANHGLNVNVPVIAMTANAMLGDRETCLAAGMDDYVSKPIDPKTLYKTISKLVEQDRAGTLRQESAVAQVSTSN
ncbi:sensory box histidine kinase/response regulator [hydrothermal vent metagenome]|uniref:Sensory box histidine kinase/response regulator n=1 Tax=hydrothermal vent metagenome TaxID=652676 RepID=A0A3B0SLM3_9ZZZZ